MAALMGVSVEELRSRVKDALSQLESEGQPAPKLPEPPPAEQRSRPRRQPPARSRCRSSPPRRRRSRRPERTAGAERDAALRPGPALAAARRQGPKAGKSGISLSSNGAKIGIAAIVGAVVIVVVLLLVLGGGDSRLLDRRRRPLKTATTTSAEASGGGSAVQEAEEAAEASSGGKEATKAMLTGDGEAKGIAIFGRVKNKLALQFVAEGLEPLAKDRGLRDLGRRLAAENAAAGHLAVHQEGKIASQFEVPTELLGYLANETFDEIAITKIASAKLDAALKEATKNKETPAYTGTPVMRGTITGPIIGAAKRKKKKTKKGKPANRPALVRQQLAGVHDPGRVEPLLRRPQQLEAGLPHLGPHVGRVVAAGGVVVADRAAVGDDRLAGRRASPPATARSRRRGGRGR